MRTALRPKRGSRRKRVWLVAAGWAFLILVSGTTISLRLALKPERVRWWIRAALASAVHGEVRFSDAVEVDYWRLAVAVRDVEVRDTAGTEVLRIRRAAVLPDLGALLAGRFEPREVVIDGPTLWLERTEGGSWNIARLLGIESLADLGSKGQGRWPALRLEAGKLYLRGSGEGSQEPGAAGFPELVLKDLFFTSATRGGQVTWKGGAHHPLARRLTVSGTFDPQSSALECEVKAAKIDLAAPAERFLGAAAAADLAKLRLQGFVDLEGKVRYDARSGLWPLYVTGRFLRCQLSPPGLFFPVRQLGGKFALRGRTLELKELEGFFGEGRITGEAALELDPLQGITGMELSARAEAIPLDHRFRAWLKPPQRTIYDQLRPEGSVGVEVKVRARPFPVTLAGLSGKVTFNGVNFAWKGFPYPFYNLTGEVALEEQALVLTRPLTARNRDAVLTLSGRAALGNLLSGQAPEGAGELAFDVRVENLPADEELREALPPSGRGIWDEFQPAGRVQLTVTARKGPREAPLSISAFVVGKGVRICYARFPYEVTGITGRMHFEFDDGGSRLTLSDLRGDHAGQTITGEGVVEWGARDMFRVDLACADLGLDQPLKEALSPSARQLLEDFSFQGRAKTEVTIHSTAEGGPQVKVELDLLSGQVAYVLFPYPLYLGGGHLTAVGEHTLRFSNFLTRERRPDGTPERPKVLFNGGIGLEGGERLLDFRFDIEDLAVDDRLRKVLPPELLRFVSNLGLEGTFRGELSGSLSYPLDHPEEPRLVYQARNVSARDAAVDFGLRMRRMEAEGEFVGGKERAGKPYFEGRVNVKAASFNRLQLKDADILFTFGKEHPSAAGFRKGSPGTATDYRPSRELMERLAPEKSAELFQMAVKKSDLYGGNVQGFLAIDVGRQHDLSGEFVAEGVQVAKAAPDVFGVADSGASGEAHGRIAFRGTTGDPLSLQGEGEGTIERARLVELPLFVGLWSLLLGEHSPQHYFNEVGIRYGIGEGKFRAASPDGLVIKSQGLYLKGGGTMDFEGKLNLSLTPEFLRVKVPVLDQLFGLLKRGLAQVWVTGDVASPRVRFVSGAGLFQFPIDTRPKPGDRPLPRELRDQPPRKGPLPPPVPPEPAPAVPAEPGPKSGR
jgi:hypothetical protein